MDRDVSRRENYSKIPIIRSDTSLDTAQKLLFSLSLSRYRLPRSDHFSLSSCQISLQLVRAEPLRTGPEYFSSGMNSPPTGRCHSSGFVPGTVKPGRKVHVRCSYRASITRANFERNNVSVPARYNSRSVAAAAVVVRRVHA